MTQGLYRAYDVDGVLLYVGRAVDIERRINEHRWNDAWWTPRVAWFDVESVADFDAMCTAERLAIQSENPRYNRIAYGPCNRVAAMQAIQDDIGPAVAPDYARMADAMRALTEAAHEYREAKSAHRLTVANEREAVRAAFVAGVAPKDIVDATGLSRTRVYEIRDRK